MPTRLADLDTPAVLIEDGRVRRNIRDMQRAASDRGLRLRPHAKTHKSPVIARWQLEAGATGITLAKVGEAEVFAAEGIDDIRLAYPLSPTTARRVVALMDTAQVSLVVDDLEVARQWSARMVEAGRVLQVLVKVDVGFRRCGLDPASPAIVETLCTIAALPGLEFRGLISHAGHSYAVAAPSDLSGIAREEARLLRTLATQLRARAIDVHELSVGSTPTIKYSLDQPDVTELRPGNYVFFDLTQVALGSATLDHCALSVLTTVVSRPAENRLVLDAGSKTLSSDMARGPGAPGGHGALFDIHLEGGSETLQIDRLSEEHGVVELGNATSVLRPGDRVRVIPNHACVVVNLADRLHLVSGDTVLQTIPVAARGKNS